MKLELNKIVTQCILVHKDVSIALVATLFHFKNFFLNLAVNKLNAF